MAEIKSLQTLAKASASASDVLLVTNTSTNSAKKYVLTNLFPSASTAGSGAAVFKNISSKNQFNFKSILSGASSKLAISSGVNEITISLIEQGIDLRNCNNANSQFSRGVDFTKIVTGLNSVFNGGTGLSSIVKGGVLYANAESQLTYGTLSTNGQLMIGNATNGYPSFATLTAGSNVTITNTAGAISIAASLSGLAADLDCNTYDINLDRAAGISWVSGDGSAEGMSVDADGRVFIGDSTPTVPTIAGQLHLCGATTNALVIGNTNDYKAHTITAMTAAGSVAGLALTLKGADCTSGNVAGGALNLEAGDATGSGIGGHLSITAGNSISGTEGSIKMYTYTSNSATQSFTIDSSQDATVNVGNLFVSAKPLYLRSSSTSRIVQYQGAEATTDDGTAVVSAANVLTGIVKCTPSADRSKVTDTAANFVSGLSLTADNDSVDWTLLNLATDGASAITLTGGTGVTLIGRMVVMGQDAAEDAIAEGVARFRIRRTGSSAVTMYRIS